MELSAVEHVWLDERAGGAGVEAGAAGAAMVGGMRLVVCQFDVGETALPKNQLPACLFSSSVFLPIQPRPANWANSPSSSGGCIDHAANLGRGHAAGKEIGQSIQSLGARAGDSRRPRHSAKLVRCRGCSAGSTLR